MRYVKTRTGVGRIGFSNQHFLGQVATLTGISPVGELGRETPLDLTSLEGARGSLLLRELYSKYDDGKPSPEKGIETWKRFHAAEALCRETNFWVPRTFRYDPYWARVRARIRQTLGLFSWDECAKGFAFGPGGTTRLPRSRAQAAYKYSGIPESTSGNSDLGRCAIRIIPLWEHNVRSNGGFQGDLVKVVPGNRIITVPKSYKTDRTIAKEPCMNIYIQKGIGRVIRNRLKRVGVDLNDQTLNQIAARKGSIDGTLATIDLSMASDTLSYELVSFLLPNDWCLGLELSRSPVGTLTSGEVIRYQKFSSMGNGYTFELESLIFWAIAQEVCCRYTNEKDSRVCVYGDDIVVPTEKAPQVLHRLFQAGFKPNGQKTFTEGPYRESCGKHYYLGHEITPFYVRKPVDKLTRLFLCHNNLQRWLQRGDMTNVSEILTGLRELAPAAWRRPRLPDGFGDGAFIGAVDELRLDSHPLGWECWISEVLQSSSEELQDLVPDGQVLASLKANTTDVSSDELQRCNLHETLSGLPVKEGRVQVAKVCIQRYPLLA